MHRLTLRGNLDFNVTDFLTISADVAGRMEMRKWGQLDCGQVFTALSTHRPNEYPLTMSPEETGLASSDGIPLFGASLLRPMNAYAETHLVVFKPTLPFSPRNLFFLDGKEIKRRFSACFHLTYQIYKQGEKYHNDYY